MAEESRSKILQRLVNDLRAAHDDNLLSITVYGSTAAEDANDTRSSHNVLIILRRIAVDDLQASLKPVRAWLSARQPMPVYFTADELKRAADVFPIEFLQMEKARKILYGSDPFEFIEISRANLRHQTEYELRTKFLQLRRLFFLASRSPETLAALMIDSLSSFAALFRAALTLKGQDAPAAKKDAVRATVNAFALDQTPFDRILEQSTRRPSTLSETEANRIFGAYLLQIERVIGAVDQIDRD